MRIVNQAAKRKLKRNLRRRRTDTIASAKEADDKIERLLIRRFDRLVSVRRFVAIWIALILFMIAITFSQIRSLIPYYQTLQPIPGGLYNEGLVGSFSNANPLYANGAADAAVSNLVFSGLFKYDTANKLVGDLATSYDLDAPQTHYTVHLRHGVQWQDGVAFSADDVIFTYTTIQNIEAQSSLYSSWQGITVTKQNNYTVTFTLPNSLSDFPYSMTNGILPEHLLKNIPVERLRSAAFNTAPIGTGPFKWKFVDVSGDVSNREQRISLEPFNKYWAGRPKLDGFSLITFSDQQQLIGSFDKKELNAMSGLDEIPGEVSKDKSVHIYTTPLTTAVMSFFNNSRPLLKDANVRKGLAAGVNRDLLGGVLGTKVQLVNGPLLNAQLGYDPTIVEPKFDLTAASTYLDLAGWKINGKGQRVNSAGEQLTLNLSSQDTPSYTKVSEFLQQEWSKLGVKIKVSYYASDDLQASVIGEHNYDILLYGITLGVDPDVFAYWDSSQASLTSQGHLNVSEYKSTAADQALEAGRTRSDPTIRAVKYKAFLTQWTQDMPALALYQPNYLYITRGPVYNYQRLADNTSSDRFYNVSNWMVRQEHKTNQ